MPPMVKTESAVAAEWWADFLRADDVRHDAGDAMASAMINAFSPDEEFDEDLVDEFEDCLAEKIDEKTERGTWDYDRPYVGQTFMKCDYGADPLLSEAAEEVGLEISNRFTFPSKTTLWLNPGEVRVREGYGGEIETIWEIGDHVEEVREFVSDWVYPAEHPKHDRVLDSEPKVFPTEGGYIIRVYGEYDESHFGQESREWFVSIDDGSDMESTLETLKEEVDEWALSGGGD